MAVATEKQQTGEFGERLVVRSCHCPKCKRPGTLKRLPNNFKCADVICDFCGYLAQVKTVNTKDIERVPATILGAAWGPQKDRMQAGVYFPLFIVLMDKSTRKSSVFYLPADLQEPDMFVPRKPLSESARRAGWQGFYYNLETALQSLVRLS